MEHRDYVRISEAVSIAAHIPLQDGFRFYPKWTIPKFRDSKDRVAKASRAGVSMDELYKQFQDLLMEKQVILGNAGLNEGLNALWTLVGGTGETEFDNGHAYIGVGDSATAADPAQTGLQAATNKLYKAMDSTYPTTGSSQQATWRSTFGSSDAVWHWQEITVANGSSDSAKNLNRKVQDMGTKAAGTTWIPSLQITAA